MEEAFRVLMQENEIVVDPDLLESIARKLDTLGKPNEADNFTIFPVPYKFRQNKKNLFDPSVVSIGPLHHGEESLKAMEHQKWLFFRGFLSRGHHITLYLCLSEIMRLEQRARRCYSESVNFDSNDFVQMMLLDGCIVLEHFLNWYEDRFHSIGHSVFIPSDLLLLENQIPFFIVEKLFEIIGRKPEDKINFTNYLAHIFARAAGQAYEYYYPIFEIPPDGIHHLVHLCYNSLIPIILEKPFVSSSESFFPAMLSRIKNLLLDFPLSVLTRIFPKIRNSRSLSNPKSTLIPCATELQNAGIKLRPTRHPRHLLDISFDHRVLEIPTLIITNQSKTLLANLLAFEQYKLHKNQEMRANLLDENQEMLHENQEMHAKLSSFALLLDSLVNMPEDVKILQKCGILNNCLDSDEELTNFFNQICEGMNVEKDHHFMAELFTAVNSYCESSWGKRRTRWNRHKTQFIDTYFSSPWTAISLVAAVIIVLLTCVQSFFAIYTYYVPRS